MTYAENGYMPLNRQLFQRSLAEALTEFLSQRYRTAKIMARAVGIDPHTAENLYKGHLSVPTLQKVLAHEGRALWNFLGDELFGETFYDYEERRIDAALREAESVRSNLVRIRAKGEELLSRAPSLDQDDVRPMARQDRGAESRTWTGADGSGNPGTRGSRDRGSR
jgi:hypothetical protein